MTEKIEAVFARATAVGRGEQFQVLYDAAVRNGLYARPFKHSIMYTPPANKTRMLFTAWTRVSDSATTLWVSPEAFAEFFHVTAEEATEKLGYHGYREIESPDAAQQFGSSLDALLALSRQREDAGAE